MSDDPIKAEAARRFAEVLEAPEEKRKELHKTLLMGKVTTLAEYIQELTAEEEAKKETD